MAKAEPNVAEVNKLISGTDSETVSEVDVKYALAVLRQENARLKENAATNARTAEQNAETHRKGYEGWRRENLRLQTELLASQDRVFELQDKLLSLRQIVNGVTVSGQPSTKE